tara:strand:- start:188 stop:424 length:237 start_codon:yes stop_codon:yes gene_type:complete
MAKKHEAGKKITTPSWFGSHTSMVVDHTKIETKNKDMELSGEKVVCQDDLGYYITEKNRLDNGLADPNRYSNSKRMVL